MEKIELPHGESWIIVIPSIDESIQMLDELYEEIWNMHPTERPTGKIMGKTIEFPRWHETYGQTYKFVGHEKEAQPIEHPYLKKIKKWVRNHSKVMTGKKQKYRQILVNWYENGGDYIGFHTDNEKKLKDNSAIYSFSFGQERDFIVKSMDKTYKQKFSMPNNSLIIMGGEMQKYYKHSVPKRALSKCSKSRINITMRLFEE